MIPRHKGLVPAIRGPASSTASAVTAEKTAAATATTATTTSIRRFVITPIATAAPIAASATATTPACSERERRLYTFLPSADVAAPPRELRVASSFFPDASPSSPSSGAVGVSAIDYEGSEEDVEDEDGTVAGGAPDSLPNHSTAAVSSSRARRRWRRKREPMRLEYQGTMDRSASAASAGGVAKLASTPVPSYSKLSCVLLAMPAGWREQAERNAGVKADQSALVSATVVPQPLLQLWGERKEAVDGGGFAASNDASSGTGISKKWESLSTTTRFSKKDWKTMDAADADLHKRTNWSDDDGGDSGDGGDVAETALSVRERKRAKAEATSHAVRSFLAGTKEALRQQRKADDEMGEEMGGEDNGGGLLLQQPNMARPASVEKQPAPSPPPPTPTPAASATLRPPTATNGRARMLTVVSPPPPLPAPAPTGTLAPPPPPPSSQPTMAPVRAANTGSGAPPATLSALSAAVLQEVRQTEKRASASMMELQKRILKQLPDFAAMSQKMKSAETKAEAVEWFQTCQRELRVWLQGQGHTIASNGMVTFIG